MASAGGDNGGAAASVAAMSAAEADDEAVRVKGESILRQSCLTYVDALMYCYSPACVALPRAWQS